MNIEQKSTYYTAVGHFRRKTDSEGHTYPVILVNQEEHMVDIQEMAVWSILNWRFLRLEQIEMKYGGLARDLPPAQRELETCLNRLEMRGLAARAWATPTLRRCTTCWGSSAWFPSRKVCP